MIFPFRRLRFTTTYQGKDDPSGWIMLDLAGMEMEGITKVWIPAVDLDRVRALGDTTSDRLKQARNLLGGNLGDEEQRDDQ